LPSGQWSFSAPKCCGIGQIIGVISFFTTPSASATLTLQINDQGNTGTGVALTGTDTASAGSSVIINNSGGTTAFFAATTAGNATIINSLGGIVQFGDSGGCLVGPSNAGDGIAGSVVFQKDLDGLDYFGRFFSTGLRPAPDCRTRPTSTS